MAKRSSKKNKASNKRVAKSATRKAAAKRKGKTKTVAKKQNKGAISKAKPTPPAKGAVKKKKATAKSAPKTEKTSVTSAARAGKKDGAKAVKRKPAARHPPVDLRRFRQRLRARQSELLQAYISTKVDSRSRAADGTEDYIDYAVSSYDREFLLSLTELEQKQLELVDAALKRLRTGEFGFCTQCECPIPIKRLEVQPWAQYCLRCQELADQGLTGENDFPSDDDEDDAGDKQSGAELDSEDDELRDEERMAEDG